MMKFITLLILFSTISFAYDFELSSSNNQTQVIELFTSEGCSSCPPADRWLSKLKNSKELWKSFIPIAFHVDYWDYIGWKDELALENNAQRQRLHKIFENIPSVYTPGILKAGKEWRAWRFSNSTDIIQSPIKVGQLTVTVKGENLISNFTPHNPKRSDYKFSDYKFNVALLGMNIYNKIKAGENDGKFLKHDFVLLKHQKFTSTTPNVKVKLDSKFFDSEHKDLAFVVWVETGNNPAAIQAVGKYL